MARHNLPGLLFSDYDLRGTFETREGRMAKAVEQYPADHLLAQGDDELLAHFVEQFRFEAPALTEGAISVDVEEAQVDVSGSFDRDTMGYSEYYVPGTRSRFVVMFISKHYVEKAFPTHERQHAQARALVAKEEYILPARFDDTEVPGLAPTVAYADLRKLKPEELADLILAKLGRTRQRGSLS